jgi:hypothetical protein
VLYIEIAEALTISGAIHTTAACAPGRVRERSHKVTRSASRAEPAGQEILAVLEKVYRGQGVQRDVFGRCSARPSEIARVLAQNHNDPSGRARPGTPPETPPSGAADRPDEG